MLEDLEESLVVVAVLAVVVGAADSVDDAEVEGAEVSEDESADELLEVAEEAAAVSLVEDALDRDNGSKALILLSLSSTWTEPESTAKRARQSQKNERIFAVLFGDSRRCRYYGRTEGLFSRREGGSERSAIWH